MCAQFNRAAASSRVPRLRRVVGVRHGQKGVVVQREGAEEDLVHSAVEEYTWRIPQATSTSFRHPPIT